MKTICIVGNSAHIKGLGLGSKIDSHDIVIRIGRFSSGDADDFGTKVTHWYLGPWILNTAKNHNLFLKTGLLDDEIAFLKNSAGTKHLHVLNWSKTNSGWSTENKEELIAKVSKSCSDVEVVHHEDSLVVPELLVYYTEEKNEISGVRIHPTTGARLIHHYVSKYGKISIAGFGGGKENVKKMSTSGYHSLETDYRLIDILIDAGKIENIEGTYIYR
jgi:hypothetical protein